MACVGDCAGDESCETYCFAESTGTAGNLAGLVDACAQLNGCTDGTCIEDNCATQLLWCVGGGHDQGLCVDVLFCDLGCTTQACADNCLALASTPEATEYASLSDCGAANSCTDIDCLETSCPGEWLSCVTGSHGCSDLWDCRLGCGGEQDCEGRCNVMGTSAGQALLGGLAGCEAVNNCTDQTCIDTNCAPEFAACQAD